MLLQDNIISNSVVPVRTYGVIQAGMVCTPNTNFTATSFDEDLPNDPMKGDVYTICVVFTNNECIEMAARNFTSESCSDGTVALLTDVIPNYSSWS